jgi:UDP-N-acetylmuramate dehydrogenase
VINLNNHFFKKIILDKEYVKIDAGVKINELLGWMLRNRLGDWEFLAGIPGTLGGAVRLNAGVRDLTEANNYLQIGDFVKEVTVLDKNGKLLRLDKKDLKFDYRESNLSNFVILQVILTKGEKKDISHIKKKINNFLNYRKKTQDLKSPSAGCVFKNPGNNKSSGELIELSGLKGKRIGDVAVSKKHANFFINLGKATAKDFLTLMEYVQRKVNYDHGVWLNPEIHIIRNL